MHRIARFWLLIGSFTVGAVAFGYLFLSFASFIAPDSSLLTTGPEERLLVMGVALVSLGTFVWAFAFAGTPEPESPADETEESDGPTPVNRNR